MCLRFLDARIVIGLALVMIGGCVIAGDDGALDEAAEAYYFRSCGPADGPALEVYIPEEPVACDALIRLNFSEPWPHSFIRLYIYGADSLNARPVYRFGTEVNPGPGLSSGGWAGRCIQSETTCTEARSGALQMLLPHHGIPQALVSISFMDGSSYERRILLKACTPAPLVLCG